MADRSNYMKNGALCWSLFVLLVSLTIAIVSSSDSKVCSADSRPHPHGMCGSKIDEAIKLVCGKGNFNERQYRKRRSIVEPNVLDMDAINLFALSDHTAQVDGITEPGMDIFMERSQARNFLNKRGHYYWNGVVCDCCYNSCSIKDITKYCKDKAKADKNINDLLGLF